MQEPREFLLRFLERPRAVWKIAADFGVAIEGIERVQIGRLQMPENEARCFENPQGSGDADAVA